MRKLINWKDHVVEFPGRFEEKDMGNGLVQLTPSPGKVKDQGTPQNGTNFNIMDLAALEAMLMASENTRNLIHVGDVVDGMVGEVVEAELNNSQVYPHNNSVKTLRLVTPRNTKDYTVTVEPVAVKGGAVGEFEISDKLLNGFKIKYTGSAKSVSVRCYVRGRI